MSDAMPAVVSSALKFLPPPSSEPRKTRRARKKAAE
jgi:hypothetical protein